MIDNATLYGIVPFAERTPGGDPVELGWRKHSDVYEDLPDREDYLGYDRRVLVGRVKIDSVGHHGTFWLWHKLFGNTAPMTGETASRLEAFMALEDAYNSWRAANPL